MSRTTIEIGPRAARRGLVVSGLLTLGIVFLALRLAAGEGADADRPVSLLLGAALGVAFERGRFCFFCLFREAVEERVTRPLLSIITAIAVGLVGYALTFGLYLPNPRGEGLPPGAHIAPVGIPLVLGAAAFGLGMVLSGACISGHLYRLGQGYLRAIPALLGSLVGFGLGFFTWNTLYLEQMTKSPLLWLPRRLGYAGSLIVLLALAALAAVVVMRLDRSVPTPPDDTLSSSGSRPNIWIEARERLLVRRWSPVATGAVVGIIGVFAYQRTTPLGVTSQLSSLSRSWLDARGALPDVLHGIDMMRGCVALVTNTITNNGWLVIGFVVASFAAALAGGRFKPQAPTVGNAITALVGGILLGWGSLTALGCTVGVLLSGTQAFAVSGLVFLVVVFASVWLGVRLRLHRLFGA